MRVRLSVGVLAVLAGFSLACADLAGGLTGTTVYVELNEAGGLRAGDAVLLSGIEIGSVSQVDLGESDTVIATLSLQGDKTGKLDPDTLFAVRETETSPPLKVLVASNVCVDAPRGVPPEQVLKGYAGGTAKILLRAGIDNPECASKLVAGWVEELEQSLDQLDDMP